MNNHSYAQDYLTEVESIAETSVIDALSKTNIEVTGEVLKKLLDFALFNKLKGIWKHDTYFEKDDFFRKFDPFYYWGLSSTSHFRRNPELDIKIIENLVVEFE